MHLMFLVCFSMFLGKSAQENQARTTILISLDGIGWQFLGNNKTDTPNFDFIERTGVKAKNLLTVNPTSTVPNHVTYVTGLYPESHGIVANDFHDPDLDAEHYLEPDCSAFDPIFFDQSEPIWSTMESRGLKSAAYFWPTSTSFRQRPSLYVEQVCYVNCSSYTPQELRKLRRSNHLHCKFDNEANPFWKRVESAVEWIQSENPPKLILLYFDYADLKGHKYGPDSIEYLKSIEWLDRYVVGYLMDRLKDGNLLELTNIMIVSDHSMAETSSERLIDLSKVIEPTMYDIKAPGIWPSGGHSADDVFQKLSTLNNPHVKFFMKKDIPDWIHWKNNRRIPPIYMQTELGWLVTKADRNRNPWKRGSHGWEPTEAMATIFYARGPSFKEGFYDNRSLRGVDLYALLCHLVGMEPLPNNGSLSNMVHLLKEEAEKKGNYEPTTAHVLVNSTMGLVPTNVSRGAVSSAGSLVPICIFVVTLVFLCILSIIY